MKRIFEYLSIRFDNIAISMPKSLNRSFLRHVGFNPLILYCFLFAPAKTRFCSSNLSGRFGVQEIEPWWLNPAKPLKIKDFAGNFKSSTSSIGTCFFLAISISNQNSILILVLFILPLLSRVWKDGVRFQKNYFRIRIPVNPWPCQKPLIRVFLL